MSDQVTNGEPYLRIEEVANRLGLPLSVLLHRVEAGDIPALRTEDDDGVHYSLRLGDLGIELDDEGLRSSAMRDDDDSDEGDEATLSAEFQHDDSSAIVRSAIVSAFNSGREPLPGELYGGLDATSRRLADDDAADAVDTSTQHGWADPDSIEPLREGDSPAPAWAVRPREPQQAPVWLTHAPAGAREERAATDPAIELEQPDLDDAEDVEDVYVAPDHAAGTLDDGMPELVRPSLDADDNDDPTFDEDTAIAEMAVPPPSRDSQFGIVESAMAGPRGDLASMSLDARELVAGLLDRWERTLEQRIYTEQRQRFQAELASRQNMVRQLQMELQTARAEHAAAQAEKDRLLAVKERELAERERDIAESRWAAGGGEGLTAPADAGRRRRWFWSRYD